MGNKKGESGALISFLKKNTTKVATKGTRSNGQKFPALGQRFLSVKNRPMGQKKIPNDAEPFGIFTTLATGALLMPFRPLSPLCQHLIYHHRPECDRSVRRPEFSFDCQFPSGFVGESY